MVARRKILHFVQDDKNAVILRLAEESKVYALLIASSEKLAAFSSYLFAYHCSLFIVHCSLNKKIPRLMSEDFFIYGERYWTRTNDLHDVNVAFYQLN